MDKAELKIKLFNLQFTELLGELVRLYPLDNSLRLLQTSSNGMIYMNPKSFAETVIEYLTPYNDKIIAKDESFFLNEIINDFEDTNFIADEIKKVHSIWSSPETTTDTKNTIWKYFIFMVKLGKTIKF